MQIYIWNINNSAIVMGSKQGISAFLKSFMKKLLKISATVAGSAFNLSSNSILKLDVGLTCFPNFKFELLPK